MKTKWLITTAAVAAMGLASSAYAIPTLTVSDGAGISSTTTAATGSDTATLSDAYWSVVIASGTSYPPLAPGNATSPFMDISVVATYLGPVGSGSPLVISWTGTGFGPSAGGATVGLTGNDSGAVGSLTYNTFYSTANSVPAGTPLTASGALTGLVFSYSALGSAGALGSPYSLSQVLTITPGGTGAHYSLDANIAIPDGGMTVAMLGLGMVAVVVARRKLANA